MATATATPLASDKAMLSSLVGKEVTVYFETQNNAVVVLCLRCTVEQHHPECITLWVNGKNGDRHAMAVVKSDTVAKVVINYEKREKFYTIQL